MPIDQIDGTIHDRARVGESGGIDHLFLSAFNRIEFTICSEVGTYVS